MFNSTAGLGSAYRTAVTQANPGATTDNAAPDTGYQTGGDQNLDLNKWLANTQHYVQGDSATPGIIGMGQYGVNGAQYALPNAQGMMDQGQSLAANSLGQAAPQLDGSQQNQFRGQQQQLAAALMAQANGTGGPSVAQQQLQQTTQGNLANAYAMAQANQGAGASGLQMQHQLAGINQQAAGQASILRSQEQMQAQGMLGQVLAGGRGQDIGVASDNANLGQRQFGMNNQAALGYLNYGQQAARGQQQGSIEQARDTQEAYERSAQRNQHTTDKFLEWGGKILAGVTGGAGAGMVQDATSGGDMGAAGAMKESPYAQGGAVPGHAMAPGNSYSNDTVPALLSPGEIVLPRSVTQSPNAAEMAKAFVQAVHAHKMANGGMVRMYADGTPDAPVQPMPAAAPDASGQQYAQALQAQAAPARPSFGDALLGSAGDAGAGAWDSVKKYGRDAIQGLGEEALSGAANYVLPGSGDVGRALAAAKQSYDHPAPSALPAPEAPPETAPATPREPAATVNKAVTSAMPTAERRPAGPNTFDKSIEEQKKAILETGRLEEEKAETVSDIQVDAYKSQEKARAAIQQHQLDRQQALKAEEDKYRQFSDDASRVQTDINPNRVWANMNTDQRMSANIGLILGGIGAAFGGGPNQALEVLRSNIASDIDAQKHNVAANMDKAKTKAASQFTLYNMARQRGLDDSQAENAAWAQGWDIAAKKAEAMASRYTAPEMKQKALQLAAELSQRAQEYKTTLGLQLGAAADRHMQAQADVTKAAADIYKAFNSGSGKPNPAAASQGAALDLVNRLEADFKAANKGTGMAVASNLPASVAPKTNTYLANKEASAALLAKARSGSNRGATPEMTKEMKAMLPTSLDSAESAKEKFAAIRRVLQAAATGGADASDPSGLSLREEE